MSLLFMNRPIKKEIVRNGLVLWLEGRDFYNSPPTSSWIDKSGNNNNGTPSGFAYTSVSGSDGNIGVKLDGIDDYCNIGNPTSLQITGELTLECVIKGSPQIGKGILTKYNYTSNQRGYGMMSLDSGDGSLLAFRYQRSATSYNAGDLLVSTKAVLDNTFHHIVCTFKPNQYAKIYVDGVLDIQDTVDIQSSIANNTEVVRLGVYDTSAYINATIKLARIYNRALSDQEVFRNYNASK